MMEFIIVEFSDWHHENIYPMGSFTYVPSQDTLKESEVY